MHRDARGEVFEPLGPEILASGTLRNTHVATMVPGAIRSNHRHAGATEIIIFTGAIKLVARDRDGKREEFVFGDGECVRVVVSPGIAHALVNIGKKDTFIVCFSDRVAGTDPQEKVQLV
jgi:dTDP-4-dehydrorhamnose 3,5-epimerase-like enzyme